MLMHINFKPDQIVTLLNHQRNLIAVDEINDGIETFTKLRTKDASLRTETENQLVNDN